LFYAKALAAIDKPLNLIKKLDGCSKGNLKFKKTNSKKSKK